MVLIPGPPIGKILVPGSEVFSMRGWRRLMGSRKHCAVQLGFYGCQVVICCHVVCNIQDCCGDVVDVLTLEWLIEYHRILKLLTMMQRCKRSFITQAVLEHESNRRKPIPQASLLKPCFKESFCLQMDEVWWGMMRHIFWEYMGIQKQQASLIALDLLLFINYVCCLRKVLFETKCRRAPTNNDCCLFQEQVTHILAIQGHGENHQTSPWLSIHRSSFPDCRCPQKDPALDHHEIPHAPWINGHKWPQMATNPHVRRNPCDSAPSCALKSLPSVPVGRTAGRRCARHAALVGGHLIIDRGRIQKQDEVIITEQLVDFRSSKCDLLIAPKRKGRQPPKERYKSFATIKVTVPFLMFGGCYNYEYDGSSHSWALLWTEKETMGT